MPCNLWIHFSCLVAIPIALAATTTIELRDVSSAAMIDLPSLPFTPFDKSDLAEGWTRAVSAPGPVVVTPHPDLGCCGTLKVWKLKNDDDPTEGWQAVASLLPDAQANQGFGNAALAISQDNHIVVATAPGNDAGGEDRGAVFVYNPTTPNNLAGAWTQVKLVASDGQDSTPLGDDAVCVSSSGVIAAASPAEDKVCVARHPRVVLLVNVDAVSRQVHLDPPESS